jgi:hypothetical protein
MSNPNEPWSNPYGQPGQQPQAGNPQQYPGYGQQQPTGYPSSPGQPTGYPSSPGQPTGYPSSPGQYPAQQGQYPAQQGPTSNPYGQPYPQGQFGQYPMVNPNRRPGGATAAAVLSYIQAGVLLIIGIILLAGAKTFDDFGGDGSTTAELAVDGVVNIALGGLFIAGAVMLTSGRTRNVLMLACVANLIDSIYWVARAESGGKALVLFFVVLPIISLALILNSSVTNWLQAKARGGAAPGPAGYQGGPSGF